MLDFDDYEREMGEVATEHGWTDLLPFDRSDVERLRLTGMSSWEAVSILA